ncbi:hypothetical protein K437DRAFT_246825 [Tilletiaria anomala UBC 951]|uniref:Transcription elongation factor SPT6 n=1 Tax=Tilletiaria anomala (strain ATCC 24038 / CBS 436.72 / UBC 951) TaxID=1037660 RepID=A0A066W4H0_TILAU|nr:uncharacterized protein K437DRAFT_246825 [Tilletiaria anomala UBC 951]KDN45969.1 hypothetical protein K437DRAFT_246825 [Tilletiaria anomala UBC 951]
MSDEESRVQAARRQDDEASPRSSDEGEDLNNEQGDIVGSGKGSDEDSSEEEEEDEEEARRVAEGFIVDEDEDEDEDDEEERKRRHRERRKEKRKQQEEEDEALDEEDLELVAENTGRKRRKDAKRLKRFRRGSASPTTKRVDVAKDLSKIFDDSDEEMPTLADAIQAGLSAGRKSKAVDYADDDDLDDFIDDDDMSQENLDEDEREQLRLERKEQKRRQKAAGKALGMDPSKVGFDRESWEALHEVFGRGDDYEWAMEAGSEGEEDEATGGKKKITYKDVFEPAQIAAKMLTEKDETIRRLDLPERIQLSLPSGTGIELLDKQLQGEELDQAAVWVSTRISRRCKRFFLDEDASEREYYPQWLECIRLMISLVLNEGLEAPYLYAHRYDELELRTVERDNIESINRVRRIPLLMERELHSLVDAALKFRTLIVRKDSLRKLFVKIHALEMNLSEEEAEDLTSTITGEKFLMLLKSANSLEEVTDLTEYLAMRYGQKMRDIQALEQRSLDNFAGGSDKELQLATKATATYKKSSLVGEYEKIKDSAVCEFAGRFGLSTDEVAENIANRHKVHYTEDEMIDPQQAAEGFIGGPFATADLVMKAGKMLLAHEIGKHPLVRKEVRAWFKAHAEVAIEPTERGVAKIDEQHQYHNFKYLRAKPVAEYLAPPPAPPAPLPAENGVPVKTPPKPIASQVQFLLALQAESETLIRMTVELPADKAEELNNTLADGWVSDGISSVSQKWNSLRRSIIEQALKTVLLPMGNVWIREWLREECREFIARRCEGELAKRISVRPYTSLSMKARASKEDMEEDEESNPSVPKVMAVSHGNGAPHKDPIQVVVLDSLGRMRRSARFAHIRPPIRNNFEPYTHSREPIDDPRAEFLALVKQFQPDVIVVNGFSPRTIQLREEIRSVATEASGELAREYEDGQDHETLTHIDVIHTFDDIARIYQHSQRAAEEYPELTLLGRYCLALARYVQSPLQEFAALGEDLTAINLNEHQRLVPKDMLQAHLQTALVTAVNEVGVRVNKALSDSYYQHLLQYVAGFGPRKAAGFIRNVNATMDGRVINRVSLMQNDVIGARVWTNSASFLRIEQIEDSADPEESVIGQPDILDTTRIHPEDYDYPRKMAADALGKDEEDLEGIHASEPCKELMEREDVKAKLSTLDLDNYAAMLESEHGLRKRTTLALCYNELISPYGDQRLEYVLPTEDEILTMLTGETKRTIDVQLIIPVKIIKIMDRGRRDGVEPDYPFLIIRHESGLEGEVYAPNAIDTWMQIGQPKLSSRFSVGQTVDAVISQIRYDSLRLELATIESWVQGQGREMDAKWRATPTDPKYFDTLRNESAVRTEAARRAKQKGSIVRLIKHPRFHYVKSGKAEEMLANDVDGAVIIRPSSRGNDHLALTWRVFKGVYQHLDVLELKKEDEYTLGKELKVGDAIYSDLDELIVGHIQPMHQKVQEMVNHEKFKESEEELNAFLTKYCLANPDSSQYGFTIDPKHAGYFKLSFKPKKEKPIQSWMVKVLPGFFMMNKGKLPDVPTLCNAFKTQYVSKTMPQNTTGRTPLYGGRTPNAMHGRTPLHGGKSPNPAYAVYRPAPPPGAPPGPPPAGYPVHPGAPPQMPMHPGLPPRMPPPGFPASGRPNMHPTRYG